MRRRIVRDAGELTVGSGKVAELPGNRYRKRGLDRTPLSITGLAPTILEVVRIKSDTDTIRHSLLRSVEASGPSDLRAGGVVVVRPDGTGHDRIFQRFKVRTVTGNPPRLIQRLDAPPWEGPWTGPVPRSAKAWLEK